MSTTNIEWTEVTWNPTTGCDRISPGCDHCFALAMAKRLKAIGSAKYQVDGDPRTSGPGFGVTVHPAVIDEPLSWRRPRTVFVNSMSDIGHARVGRSALARIWAVMALTARHQYQILSKRPRNLARTLSDPGFVAAVAQEATEIIGRTPTDLGRWRLDLGGGRGGKWTGTPTENGNLWSPPWPLPNVWVGTSIESYEYCWRSDVLRAVPAAVRFLSLEPLLGPLPNLDLTAIDWVIVGGESGPGARPMHPDWARSLRDQCHDAGTAFYFKQWGEWLGVLTSEHDLWEPQAYVNVATGAVANEDTALAAGGDWTGIWRVGKKAAGRELDGRTWNQFPVRKEGGANLCAAAGGEDTPL
jgi:protein gp37